MNIRVAPLVPTYNPSPPWIDGQSVIRNSDGVLFVYSELLNALTVDPNVAGIEKDANNYMIKNLPSPVDNSDAANKLYVDTTGGSGGISEAPTDGGIYARQNSTWTETYDGGSY